MKNTSLYELINVTKNLNVLYVEDEKDIREQFISILKNLFKSVTACSNAEEALELYTENGYDIIITDIYMSTMSGIELAEKIFSINRKQKIIAMSAYYDSETLESLINVGMSSYIQKPVNHERLFEILYKVCNDYITDTKEQEKMARKDTYLRNFDSDTKLKNANQLHLDLQTNSYQKMIIIYVQNFHTIQVLYGKEKTTKLLLELKIKLEKHLKNHSTLYRVSLTRFAYLISEKINLQHILNEMQDLFYSSKFNIILGASRDNNLHKTSEMALSFALKNKLNHKIYTKEIDLRKEYVKSERVYSIINNAIESRSVFPVFQPIYNKNKQILKYEVLMRISNIENGEEQIYSPAEFMKTSMETNRLYELSLCLLDKVFLAFSKNDKVFSLNISFDDIQNELFLEYLEKQLQKHPSIGERLIFEILETTNVEDYEILNSFITKFKQYGIAFAIDDFGAGYSNLNHLVHFHSDYIKIDGELIKNIHDDNISRTIVKSIITFAKELKVKTIAEYVENHSIFETLIELGIDEFQGYYLSKPLRVLEE